MKKITLGILMLAGMASFAQMGMIPYANFNDNVKRIQAPKNLLNGNHPKTLAANQHFILGYAQSMYAAQTAGFGANASDFTSYLNPIFMDSTTFNTSSAGLGQIFDMRGGVMFDISSPVFDTTGNYTTSSFAGAYNLDTILIASAYQVRNNITDTLLVEIEYGAPSAIGWQSLISSASPRKIWITPTLTSSALDGNKSHLTPSSLTSLTVKVKLTAADTVTVGAKYPGYIAVPVNKWVPAGSVVAATAVFVPGKAYPKGDVIFSYSGATTSATDNGFGMFMYGQSSTAAANSAYFYDSIATATKLTFNSSLVFYPAQRYGKYTGTLSFLNNCMQPDANNCWVVDFIISSSPASVNEKVADKLKVSQNAPNPFNDITTINYELAENANVAMDMFDITGKKIQSIEGGKQSSGSHSMQINAGGLQAGVYFYTLTAGDARVTKRMTIVK